MTQEELDKIVEQHQHWLKKDCVVPYDKNLFNYPKETKDLLKLCRKVCDRIAKDVV